MATYARLILVVVAVVLISSWSVTARKHARRSKHKRRSSRLHKMVSTAFLQNKESAKALPPVRVDPSILMHEPAAAEAPKKLDVLDDEMKATLADMNQPDPFDSTPDVGQAASQASNQERGLQTAPGPAQILANEPDAAMSPLTRLRFNSQRAGSAEGSGAGEKPAESEAQKQADAEAEANATGIEAPAPVPVDAAKTELDQFPGYTKGNMPGWDEGVEDRSEDYLALPYDDKMTVKQDDLVDAAEMVSEADREVRKHHAILVRTCSGNCPQKMLQYLEDEGLVSPEEMDKAKATGGAASASGETSGAATGSAEAAI